VPLSPLLNPLRGQAGSVLRTGLGGRYWGALHTVFTAIIRKATSMKAMEAL